MNSIKRIHLEQIHSTNSWAKEHVNQWDLEGLTLITAACQTAGRGRGKRCWESPPSVNIYATFCSWLDVHCFDTGHIPQLLALAAVETLEKEGFNPKIKWPNDLLLNSKKIGGILCETIVIEDKLGIVCGIGLNINMSREMLVNIDQPATSLRNEAGYEFDLPIILERLIKIYSHLLEEFIVKGFSSFFPLFQEKSLLKKGDVIRFHDNQNILNAQFETLHPNGSVELRMEDGRCKKFYAGEFVY